MSEPSRWWCLSHRREIRGGEVTRHAPRTDGTPQASHAGFICDVTPLPATFTADHPTPVEPNDHEAHFCCGEGEQFMEAVYGLIVDHPMWIGDDGHGLDYSPEREQRIGDFLDALQPIVRAYGDQREVRGRADLAARVEAVMTEYDLGQPPARDRLRAVLDADA